MNTPTNSEALPLTTCSAGWFVTGWQRKWTRTTGNDWYVARVFSRVLDAEDRYQRENKMGRYSLPNTQISGDIPSAASSVLTNENQ